MKSKSMILMCACIAGVTNIACGFDTQAVIEAVSNGNMTVVSNFLSQGGDVNLRDDLSMGGYTLLMYAVRTQKPEMCRLLLQNGARVNDLSRAGETACNLAQLRYGVTLPQYHEKRIADAEKRLESAGEKYQEVTRKRIEYYKKQYKETDTSDKAQQCARQIVEMLKSNLREGAAIQEKKQAVSLPGSNSVPSIDSVIGTTESRP